MKLNIEEIKKLAKEYEEQEAERKAREEEKWYFELLHENAGDRT